jgi:hypothetical protein
MLMPILVSANDYNQLKGFWSCQEEGVPITLEFKSRQQLSYAGQTYSYQLAPGIIQVQEDYGWVNYFYMMEQGVLTIVSPDGSAMQCRRTKAPKPKSRTARKAVRGWPPPYARPQGAINEYNPDAQALLYKFAGRWDHVTTNTLTNLYLKPDGTYEEAYDSGYSGQFYDQGGYQTGHWGAAGAQQAHGRWKVVGSLRQGKLYMTDQHGVESVYNYQVHIKGGEVFWGEYFFNGKLYSVNYIYR